uniref:Uncharacterized protein n=1 Tax=Glossina palpalis gambiensis TaxID=67801 RepID=A0A1B0BUF8_9MUSC
MAIELLYLEPQDYVTRGKFSQDQLKNGAFNYNNWKKTARAAKAANNRGFNEESLIIGHRYNSTSCTLSHLESIDYGYIWI